MKPIIHSFETPEGMADSFALHLALSGGKTPSLLFSHLAEKYAHEVPWQKIHFWWGDERMVAPDDPESNYGLVNQLLFSIIGLPECQIHRIKGEADPEEEAKRYSLEIQSLVPMKNNWPEFDLIMLGLGDDGHTASIFPGQMQLMESEETTAVAKHPLTSQLRITLTGKVLNNAKKVVFLISGASKAGIFKEIIDNSKGAFAYPASYIHPVEELHWFVDEGYLERNK
jgi:6-phosphogluconolactonase